MKKHNISKSASRAALAALFMGGLAAPAAAEELEPLREPQVFTSQGGALDLLMSAEEKPIADLGGVNGWVYSVCRMTSVLQLRCPAAGSTVSDYGGVRLALQPGDRLKIRLVNRLISPPRTTTSTSIRRSSISSPRRPRLPNGKAPP